MNIMRLKYKCITFLKMLITFYLPEKVKYCYESDLSIDKLNDEIIYREVFDYFGFHFMDYSIIKIKKIIKGKI